MGDREGGGEREHVSRETRERCESPSRETRESQQRESSSESRETRERERFREVSMGFLLFQMTPDKKLFPNAILGLYFN